MLLHQLTQPRGRIVSAGIDGIDQHPSPLLFFLQAEVDDVRLFWRRCVVGEQARGFSEDVTAITRVGDGLGTEAGVRPAQERVDDHAGEAVVTVRQRRAQAVAEADIQTVVCIPHRRCHRNEASFFVVARQHVADVL